MTSGEYYDIKIYRKNVVIYEDTEDVVSFTVERTTTTEKAVAQIRLDAEHITNFKVRENDALEVSISSGGSLTKIFSGKITNISKVQEDSCPYIDITASDWGILLSDRKINQSYPIVISAATIVKGIVSDITTIGTPGANDRFISVNNVEEVGKTRTVDFVGLTMFEALQKLTEYTQCDFYIDANKDLNWFQRGSRSSSQTLTSSDLSDYEYVKDTDVVNWARVYGAPNRTEPDYNLDAWSETLEGWDSIVTGGSSTIIFTSSPSTFSAQGSWTRNRASEIYSETIPVDSWTLISLPWHSAGTSPWLDTSDSSNYIYARIGDALGSTVSDWGFPSLDTDDYSVNIKDWNNLSLCIQGKYTTNNYGIPVFTPIYDQYLGDWTGHWGEATAVQSPSRMVFIQDTDSTGGYVYKTLDDETGNLYASFELNVVAASYYTNGDEVLIVKIDSSTYATTPVTEIWLRKETVSGNPVWHFRMKGYDKNGNQYILTTNSVVPSGTWTTFFVEVKGVGSSTTGAYLYDSTSTLIASQLNINTSGRRCDRIFFEAMFTCPYRTAPTGFEFKGINVYATKKTITFSAFTYKRSYGDWYPSGFSFTFQDYELTNTTKTLDLTSAFTIGSFSTVLNDINDLYMRLIYDSSAGVTDAGGEVQLTYAYLLTNIDLYYGEGSPYIGDDDVDEDYVQSLTQGSSDYWWSGFDIDASAMASFTGLLIMIEGRALSSGYAIVTVFVQDSLNPANKIDLDIITFTTTSFSTKVVNATSYITSLGLLSRQQYALENLAIGFEFSGGTATGVRITYAYILGSYLTVSALLSLDLTVNKAGSNSIKLYWAGEDGVGTLTAQMWKTLPEPIVCQTLDSKEGFTSFAFAALLDMSISSSLDHWTCPDAKLDLFTVILEDANTIQIKYSANDLYPESTFSATPRPEATTMKEIHVPIGEDSEVAGQWEVVVPSTIFDWKTVSKIYFSATGKTDTSLAGNPFLSFIEMWIDWLHFEAGKWYADYQLIDSHYSVTNWGRSYGEIFDSSCFSYEDCYTRAKYYVETNKYPRDYLTNVQIDYVGMETLNPGELVTFNVPEGDFIMRITKITWSWDGNLWGQLDLDTEGLSSVLHLELEEIMPLSDIGQEARVLSESMHMNESLTLNTGGTEKMCNNGFESGYICFDFPLGVGKITTTNPHSGTYCFHTYGNYYGLHLDAQYSFYPFAFSKITSFTFWYRSISMSSALKIYVLTGPIGHGYFYTLTTDSSGVWHQYDILARMAMPDDYGHIPAGSEEFQSFEIYSLVTEDTAVDDFSMKANP